MRDGPKTVIGFEAPRTLVSETDRMAERLNVSRSEILRLALLSFIERDSAEE